jgi:hypothetical protein
MSRTATALSIQQLRPVSLALQDCIRHAGLCIGFCGSLTTFSGWQLDVFRAWTNESRSGLHNVSQFCCESCSAHKAVGGRRNRHIAHNLLHFPCISCLWLQCSITAVTPIALPFLPSEMAAAFRFPPLRRRLRVDNRYLLHTVSQLSAPSYRRSLVLLPWHPYTLYTLRSHQSPIWCVACRYTRRKHPRNSSPRGFSPSSKRR